MNFRNFEKLVGETWAPVKFEDLRPGDRFRFLEYELIHEATCDSAPRACEPAGNMVCSVSACSQSQWP
jgi:hypothetical protein